MKNKLKFLCPTVGLGVLCLGLRIWMLNTGIDDKGLLERGNVLNIVVGTIAIGYFVFMLLLCRQLREGGSYQDHFPACKLSGGLSMAGGVVIMIAVAMEKSGVSGVGTVLGAAAAVSMLYTGLCRIRGQQPVFLFHVAVCLFFMIVLVTRYQQWSSDPEIHEYGFQILGCVALMVCAYLRACCDNGAIQRRRLLFFGMVSCFICLICLSDPVSPLFFAGAGLWAAGSMCTMEPAVGEPEPVGEIVEE